MRISEAQRAVDAWIGQFKEGYWPPLTNLARLTEELGEVASEIAHLEDHGAKSAKHGDADPAGLASEIEDLLHNTFALIRHYDIGDLVDAEVAATARRHTCRGSASSPAPAPGPPRPDRRRARTGTGRRS